MIKKVLKFLPPVNLVLLKTLCEFLHKVMQNQEVNKMTSSNLAIVFAPNLLRPPQQDDLKAMFGDSKHANALMKTLIEQYTEIFEQVRNGTITSLFFC